jgi:hypothetical protein
MCKDIATPPPPNTDGLLFLEKTLHVWEAIKNVLDIAEELRNRSSIRKGRVEVY